MDDFVSIMAKLQRALSLLEITEVRASNENLKCMLAVRETIEEIKSDIAELRKKVSIKEAEEDAE